MLSLSDERALIGRSHELDTAAALLEWARAGQSGVLIVRRARNRKVGPTRRRRRASAGICHRARVESSRRWSSRCALQQLCRPFSERVLDLPGRNATRSTPRLVSAPARRDRYLVGLAVLQLMVALCDDQPVLCLIDAQWLDRVSADDCIRRTPLCWQSRSCSSWQLAIQPTSGLAGLPELRAPGSTTQMRRFRFGSEGTDGSGCGPCCGGVAEPLAARVAAGLTTAELVEGVGTSGADRLTGSLEEGFAQRLRSLPADTRRLLALAAAEPLGDPTPLWRRRAARAQLGRGARRRGGRTHRVRVKGLLSTPVGRVRLHRRVIAGAARCSWRARVRDRSDPRP